MKNMIQIRRLLIRSTFTLALAGLPWLPTAGSAQEKGATQLMQFNANKSATALTSATPVGSGAMSCPKCKDTLTTVVEKTGKAVQPQIQSQVQKHACPGCGTTIVTEGHGKAATSKAVHACKESGNTVASCCAMK
jgi:transposase-like protein